MDNNNINNEVKDELKREAPKKDSSKKPQKQSRRKLFIILGIIVALVLAGGTLWLVFNKNSAKQDDKQSEEMSLTDIYHQALDVNDKGDYDQAQKMLDDVLEEDKTEDTKTFILSAKTGMALNQERYQEAYDIAAELNAVQAGFNSYQLLAKASLGLGNKDEAIKYFKSALDFVVGDDEFAEYDRTWLQSEIDKIERGE